MATSEDVKMICEYAQSKKCGRANGGGVCFHARLHSPRFDCEFPCGDAPVRALRIARCVPSTAEHQLVEIRYYVDGTTVDGAEEHGLTQDDFRAVAQFMHQLKLDKLKTLVTTDPKPHKPLRQIIIKGRAR